VQPSGATSPKYENNITLGDMESQGFEIEKASPTKKFIYNNSDI
jgi:hypothetical protein